MASARQRKPSARAEPSAGEKGTWWKMFEYVSTNRAVRDEARKRDGIVIGRPIHRGRLDEEPDSNERFEILWKVDGDYDVINADIVDWQQLKPILTDRFVLIKAAAPMMEHLVLPLQERNWHATAAEYQQMKAATVAAEKRWQARVKEQSRILGQLNRQAAGGGQQQQTKQQKKAAAAAKKAAAAAPAAAAATGGKAAKGKGKAAAAGAAGASAASAAAAGSSKAAAMKPTKAAPAAAAAGASKAAPAAVKSKGKASSAAAAAAGGSKKRPAAAVALANKKQKGASAAAAEQDDDEAAAAAAESSDSEEDLQQQSSDDGSDTAETSDDFEDRRAKPQHVQQQRGQQQQQRKGRQAAAAAAAAPAAAPPSGKKAKQQQQEQSKHHKSDAGAAAAAEATYKGHTGRRYPAAVACSQRDRRLGTKAYEEGEANGEYPVAAIVDEVSFTLPGAKKKTHLVLPKWKGYELDVDGWEDAAGMSSLDCYKAWQQQDKPAYYTAVKPAAAANAFIAWRNTA